MRLLSQRRWFWHCIAEGSDASMWGYGKVSNNLSRLALFQVRDSGLGGPEGIGV